MRLPPSVRYFPSRLQTVFNPWLWLGILVTGIVGVYAWEYRQNPGQLWQLGEADSGFSGDSTSTDALLESLTPEEQAVAAELDNVELLLAQLDSDISALTAGGDLSAAASLNEALGISGETGESGVERLTRYIDDYSFLGTRARGSNFQAAKDNLAVPVQRPTESVLTLQSEADQSSGAQASGVLPPNALAEALARQQAEQAANSTQTDSDPINSDLSTLPGSNSTATPSEGSNTPTFSFEQTDTGVVPGSLGGLNQPFIRTTPNMSPPPGTTGYVPPVSLPSFNQGTNGASPFSTPPSGAFSNSPSVTVPGRSQVLPSAESSEAPPLEIPTFEESGQTTPNQPRNAWESFWD
ncbi:MAG: hypothetical protein AAGF93_14015 [Cyanobacteria bacterium P01_H01_bin.105]